MAARRIRREQRREDMAESRRRNRTLKIKERAEKKEMEKKTGERD